MQFWTDNMFKFQVLKDQNKTLQAEVQKLQTLLSEPVQPVYAEVVSNILSVLFKFWSVFLLSWL